MRSAPGKVSAVELVDAAIARVKAVNPALNGLAHEAFGQARVRAAEKPGGYFDGVPTFIKDDTDVEGMPTMNGHRRLGAQTQRESRRLRAVLPGHRAHSRWVRPSCRSSASAPSAEHPRIGAVRNPWDTDYTAGASSSGAGAFVAAGVVPDGLGQRRRRLDPHPGGMQRPGGTQAVARPTAAGGHSPPAAGANRHQRRADPFGPRHRGVLPGRRADLAQPIADPDRRGYRTRPGTSADRRRHPFAEAGLQSGHP